MKKYKKPKATSADGVEILFEWKEWIERADWQEDNYEQAIIYTGRFTDGILMEDDYEEV